MMRWSPSRSKKRRRLNEEAVLGSSSIRENEDIGNVESPVMHTLTTVTQLVEAFNAEVGRRAVHGSHVRKPQPHVSEAPASNNCIMPRDDERGVWSPGTRSPSVRSPSLRSPSLRSPSLRSPSLRSPSTRSPTTVQELGEAFSATMSLGPTSLSAADKYLNEYSDCIVAQGSRMRGTVTLGHQGYDLTFEHVEKMHSKYPDWYVFYYDARGRKARLGAAWERHGPVCWRYVRVVLEADGVEYKFNAFQRRREEDATIYELVPS